MKNKIQCPLVKQAIEDGICFDISMVAEDLAPTRTISDEVKKIDNYKKICLSCEFHRD